MDKAALFKLSYGLYVIGVKNENKMGGCVVNTAMQITSQPPRVSITIAKENATHDLVQQAKHCTVSVLAQDCDMNIIAQFGFQSSRETDKYDGVDFKTDEQGAPYLTRGTVAYFSCQVINQVDVGTHTIFVCEVQEGEVLAQNEPMTYSYYRQVKKGTVPKAAPTYKEEESTKQGWKCSVCGYETDQETLPDDYVCPICKQPKSVFKKI